MPTSETEEQPAPAKRGRARSAQDADTGQPHAFKFLGKSVCQKALARSLLGIGGPRLARLSKGLSDGRFTPARTDTANQLPQTS